MLETIANLVANWALRQYQRFGMWSVAVVAVVLLMLGGLAVRGCSAGRIGSGAAHFGMSDAEWQKYCAAQGIDGADAANLAREKEAQDRAAQRKVAAKPVAKPPPSLAATPPAPKFRAPPPKPVRPTNFADWKKDDFLAARAEGDPRLPGAITDLGQRSKGNPAAVAFVTSLLEAPGPLGRDHGSLVPPAKLLAEAVVAALAANGTEAATAALRAIVNGKLPTPDDRAATAAALRALAARGNRDTEELLFAALTVPAEIRAPGGPMEPPELQKLAAAIMQSSGSASLRLRLACYLVCPDTPPSVRQQLIGCLTDARVENLAAQTVLYGSEEIDLKVRGALEQRFTAASAEALGRALGLPASQTAPAAAGPAGAAAATGPVRPGWATFEAAAANLSPVTAAPPPDPVDAVRFLWTDAFAEILDRRLSLAEALGQAQGTLALSATVPNPAARSALYRMLSKHWYEGPRGADAGTAQSVVGAWSVAITDPGLLLVLKALPRKGLSPPPPVHHAAKHGGKSAASKSTPAAKSAQATAGVKRARELVEQWWIERSELLVRTWCARLHRTALGAQAAGAAASAAARPEPPLALHPGARPRVVYHCDWPGRLAEKIPAAARDPLDVYYVRIEEKSRPERILAYYRRQWESSDERATQSGAWLDYCGSGTRADRKRSIDVVVTRAAPSALALADEELDLVVEILWIEARDPAFRSEALAGSGQP